MAMPVALLVIGPSRSGSSALTAVMGLLGATLPRTLIPPGKGNERGHFESQRLMELNSDILALHGGTYWDPIPLPPAWFASAEAAGWARRIAGLITEEFGDAALPVIKDPRLCRLAPLYFAALAELGRTPLAVLPLRHPGAGAASLSGRDGTLAETAELLQVRELLGAERHTRALPRALVRYDALLADWRGTMATVAAGLGLAWPVAFDDAAAVVADFLEPAMRHHDGAPAGSLALRLYEAALAGAGGDEAAMRTAFDTAGSVLDELDRLNRPWQVLLRARAGAADTTLAAQAAERRRLEKEVAGLRRDLADADAEIARLQATASWRLTAPLRALGRLFAR
jgi:hypothetical protein